MLYHIDPECDQALIKLNDKLCSFERNSGREYTLVLIPHSPNEKIQLSVNGKPLTGPNGDAELINYVLAMEARKK